MRSSDENSVCRSVKHVDCDNTEVRSVLIFDCFILCRLHIFVNFVRISTIIFHVPLLSIFNDPVQLTIPVCRSICFLSSQ